MLAAPVRYTTDIERIMPDEQETIAGLCETFDEILKTTSEDYGHAVRSVHAKAHGILRGTFRIETGLSSDLAQGLFRHPGEHPVYMRFSTNAGDILPDTISLPRGLALKILDVDGERLPDAEGTTQDFVMINGPVFVAETADQFLGNVKLLAKTTDRAEGLKKAFSAMLRGINTALEAVGLESAKIQTLGGAPNVDPLGETYYSVTPFRYGDYIAKFAVVPVSADLARHTGEIVDTSDRPDAIRETVRAGMMSTDAVWEMRVQLCRDLEKQPVEDPTVEWNQEEAPYCKVGTITVTPQDSWDPQLVQAVDEGMRFSVWTGLAAHRPLGNINRARKEPYEQSAKFREGFNRCPIHEPF